MTQEESILYNLETWCYEVGSDFEDMGRQAAKDFIKYAINKNVLELGCGDGSTAKVFKDNNIRAMYVDINLEKLLKIPYGLIWKEDMLEALRLCKSNTIGNIFAHHSLEHVVEVEEVLKEVARVMRPLGIFYAIVPADDYLHTVHHVVFESAEELLPKKFKPIVLEKQYRNEPEFICIAQKLP